MTTMTEPETHPEHVDLAGLARNPRVLAAAGLAVLIVATVVVAKGRPAGPAGSAPVAPPGSGGGADWETSLTHMAKAFADQLAGITDRIDRAEGRLYMLEQGSTVDGAVVPPA